MTIPDSELQAAVQEYQEWGEKLRIPRETRIAALLPHRSETEVAGVISLCKRVEDAAWEIATAVRDGGMSQDEALARLRERFPFMSQVNLSRTFSQAMYYTMK